MPSTKRIHASYLEINCNYCFQYLTSGDLKWPPTLTRNNRVCILNATHHMQVQNASITPTWNITLTRFSVFDLWWYQITFDLCQKPYGSPTFKNNPCSQHWDILYCLLNTALMEKLLTLDKVKTFWTTY